MKKFFKRGLPTLAGSTFVFSSSNGALRSPAWADGAITAFKATRRKSMRTSRSVAHFLAERATFFELELRLLDAGRIVRRRILREHLVENAAGGGFIIAVAVKKSLGVI